MAERPLMRALDDAADGLARTFREQRNFRIQVFVGALVVVLATVMNFSTTRWAILALTIGVVLGAELVNTAIERAVDGFAPNEMEAARTAKHAGAGAVLAVSIAALLVGVWLFGGAIAER